MIGPPLVLGMATYLLKSQDLYTTGAEAGNTISFQLRFIHLQIIL